MTGTDFSRVGNVISRVSVRHVISTLLAGGMAAVISHANRCHSILPPSPTAFEGRATPRQSHGVAWSAGGGGSTAAAAADCSIADFQIG